MRIVLVQLFPNYVYCRLEYYKKSCIVSEGTRKFFYEISESYRKNFLINFIILFLHNFPQQLQLNF
jgi:hypothetical protein